MCDRAFLNPWELERHMIKRRHWLCIFCEKIFNTLMQLEHHKEIHGHWSDDEYDTDNSENSEDEITYDSLPDKIYEEETVFGPDEDKTILLCNQF